MIAPVTLLHVADHLVAPVLAKVDVEVGHRHALGIEKALEQKPEADRIEIGDRQRIGNQGACARAAAGADWNAFRLRPLNEIGDDQEVAGIFHAGDDAQFEIEPRAVFVFGMAGRDARARQPSAEARFRALAQFARLVAVADREARQDRIVGMRAEGAALGDLDRARKRLRQIGKQRDHLGAALEAVLGIELAAVGLGEQPPLRDADQRVVRFVVGGGCKIRLVGRDQRQTPGIGEIDQHRLGGALARRAVALQLNIKPVAEQARQRVKPRGGEMALPGRDRAIERPARPAGERDDAAGFAVEPFELEARRLVRRRVEEGARGQPHQAAIAVFARRRAAQCVRAGGCALALRAP